MGIENYDLIWQDLEAVMQKYGYQIGILYDSDNNTITAKFHKEEEFNKQ